LSTFVYLNRAGKQRLWLAAAREATRIELGAMYSACEISPSGSKIIED
jgi:hypothetical protein